LFPFDFEEVYKLSGGFYEDLCDGFDVDMAGAAAGVFREGAVKLG
jgi:hypothetical protein